MKRDEILFASDVHLTLAGNPGRNRRFLEFLDARAKDVRALYILGDLFDYWTGPVMLEEPGHVPFFEALRTVITAGTEVTLLQGNRDFLLGPVEARRLGVSVPGERTDIRLGDDRYLLAHGDLFCTRDRAYQRMKRVIRSRPFRLFARFAPGRFLRAMARRLRARSMDAVRRKTSRITDLDPDALRHWFRRGYDGILCGHIHRRRDERIPGGGRLITLSDWSEDGGDYALWDGRDLKLARFGRDGSER